MQNIGVVLLLAVASIGSLAILFTMLKTKRFICAALLSVLQGIGALFAANFIGSFINVHISVNPFTLSVGALGGLPGVSLLWLADVLFR